MFKNILSNCDWEALYSEYNPDVAYSEFLVILQRNTIPFFQKSRKKLKKITTFKPIGNHEYSERNKLRKILEKRDLRF